MFDFVFCKLHHGQETTQINGKKPNVIHIHKKDSKNSLKNYKPISFFIYIREYSDPFLPSIINAAAVGQLKWYGI